MKNTIVGGKMYGNIEKKPLIVCALEVETQGQLDDYDVL